MICDKYIYKNGNGHTYAILKIKDDTALLKDLTGGQFVVARGFDRSRECWDGGSYFGSDLNSALEFFNEE